MNVFTILLKLWPAIKDAFFGGLDFSSYIRRNKGVAMLLLALVVTFCAFLFIYEEAFMHGAISKAKTQQITTLKARIAELEKVNN